MLIEFSMGNYRSFRDIVTLSMVASKLRAKTKTIDETNIRHMVGHPSLLTSAAIYGANASGKSNLVLAMEFMRDFVLNSPVGTYATGFITVENFRLSTEAEEQPSHFEMVFIIDNVRYRYGFETTPERVIAEWLFYVPNRREARLFERELDQVILGENFKEGRDIIERTRPNALFLSVVAQFNGQIAQKVSAWFGRLNIASGLQDVNMRAFTMRSFLKDGLDEEIINLIKILDLSIENLVIKQEVVGGYFSDGYFPDGYFPEGYFSGENNLRIYTTHSKYNGEGQKIGCETFNLDEQESEGTKKLFALSGPLIVALRDGQTLIIDELDARLHPLMTCEIIRLFNSKETNPKNAQLIFTTHDTNLLGNNLFRRDQIWFTEKDREGATDLYSLAEFKVRNDASYEQNYIKGRYGAIPLLDNIRYIAEED